MAEYIVTPSGHHREYLTPEGPPVSPERIERAAQALVDSGYLFTLDLSRTVARIVLNTE